MKRRRLGNLVELVALFENGDAQPGLGQDERRDEANRPRPYYDDITIRHVLSFGLALQGQRRMKGLGILVSVEIQTLFSSIYSRMPAMPHSRPMPLILKPPNGAAASKTS